MMIILKKLSEVRFRKEKIDVELQNPDLNPLKEKMKRNKKIRNNVLKDAFRGLKDAFTEKVNKNFLGAKTGIGIITVGRFAIGALIRPNLIKFRKLKEESDSRHA